MTVAQRRAPWRRHVYENPSYKGKFADGQFHGTGELFRDDDTLIYRGQFHKHDRHGQGVGFLDGVDALRYEGGEKDEPEGTGCVRDRQM